LPIKNCEKSTDLSLWTNTETLLAHTTAAGKLFHTFTTRTTKKCCLQLTLDSGRNSL